MRAMKSLGWLALPIMGVIFILAAPVRGDVFMKQATHTDAYEVMGQKQPAEDDTSMIWLTTDRACMTGAEEGTIIVRADKGVIYIIDHEAKTYAEMSTDMAANMEAMMGDQAEDPEAAAMMKKMMEGAMAMVKVTVTPSNETKQIKGWTAKKYIVEATIPMGVNKSEMWVNEEMAADAKLYHKVTNAMMMSMPGFERIMAETEKIKGVPVLTLNEASVAGAVVKSQTELLEYTKKDAPAGIYELPAGYKKTDLVKDEEEE